MLMLQWFARRSIYPVCSELVESPAEYGCHYEDVYFPSTDGCRLHGWWIPGEKAQATLMLCHANGENVSSWAGIGCWYGGLPCNFWLFDYRGYGRSTGRPSEAGLYADALAAFDWAAHRGQPSLPMIAMGRSLGTAVATHLATQRPLAGLVVESGFTSMIELASRLSAFPKFLVQAALRNEQFAILDKIAAVGCPKLIAHSPEDEMIPYEMGRRLFAAAAEPKTFCELAGGHNVPAFEQPRYRQALAGFIADIIASASASAGAARPDQSMG